MKYLFLLLFFPVFLQAQIVNIEKLRLVDTMNNHVGFEAMLGFGISKNTSGQVMEGNGNLRLDYYFKGKSKLLLMGAFGINRFKARNASDAIKIRNNQFVHLRYNRKLTKCLTWEVFTQGQINQVELVVFRWLVGTGPRFKILHKKDKGYIYFGSMYMFERAEEERDGLTENVVLNHHRLSNYLSMSYRMNENASLNHVTYFQPRVDEFSDFRISSETGLSFTLFKKIKWKTYFQYLYDSKPPTTVIESRYQLRNGISIAF